MMPERDYAVRIEKNESAHIRFGPGQGLYLAIEPATSGRFVYTLDYETGDPTLLARMPEGQPIVVGRISECLIKIMHAIVSRRHLSMRVEGNILILRDLGSTNGSFISTETPHFDIASYLEKNPVDGAEERTLDAIHEQFGPALDDFLKTYSQNKEEPK